MSDFLCYLPPLSFVIALVHLLASLFRIFTVFPRPLFLLYSLCEVLLALCFLIRIPHTHCWSRVHFYGRSPRDIPLVCLAAFFVFVLLLSPSFLFALFLSVFFSLRVFLGDQGPYFVWMTREKLGRDPMRIIWVYDYCLTGCI